MGGTLVMGSGHLHGLPDLLVLPVQRDQRDQLDPPARLGLLDLRRRRAVGHQCRSPDGAVNRVADIHLCRPRFQRRTISSGVNHLLFTTEAATASGFSV